MRSLQLLDKRRHDHEAELRDLEERFTTMLTQRQQAYDRNLNRLQEEAQEQAREAAAVAADRARAEMGELCS